MPSFVDSSSARLRLVRPPRDYSRIGEMIVRMAELAATYHAAQAVRGCTPASTPTAPSLRLVRPDANEFREVRA